MPQLIQVVRLHDDRRVVGLTSVDSRRLFVLRYPSDQHIEVYETTTFKLQQTLNVAGLRNNVDNSLTSCVVNNCLYVSAYESVYKIELTGENQVFKWRIEGDSKPRGLSVNTTCNLLVSCEDNSYKNNNKLLEYTSSGSLVREIRLESMMRPMHAVQLISDQFVVCTRFDDHYDVVEVNSRGQFVVSYENQLQSTTRQQFNFPSHLALNKSNECIFVADKYNDRIVMLTRSLKCAREFKPSVDGSRLREPHRLCLDQSNSRLYVGERVRGRIFAFDVRRRF